jgi:hypothetical protein
MVLEEFKHVIAESIKGYLHNQNIAKVELVEVTKNNDTKLTGITVMEKDESLSPTIYLNDYFERYQEGEDLANILTDIVSGLMEAKIHNREVYTRDYSDLMAFDKVRDRIYARTVGLESNVEYLKDKVYDEKNDMALVYFILIDKKGDNIKSCALHQEMFDSYGISKEQLQEIAIENTQRFFPPILRTMDEVLEEMVFENYEVVKKSFDQSLHDMALKGIGRNPSMLILSNENNINGATVLFYPGILDKITETLDTDVYILPSSVHETIIVPKNDMMIESELTNMVQEVNETQVADQEVLTNHVYEYTRELGRLTIIGSEVEHEKEKVPVEVNRAARKNIRSR